MCLSDDLRVIGQQHDGPTCELISLCEFIFLVLVYVMTDGLQLPSEMGCVDLPLIYVLI